MIDTTKALELLNKQYKERYGEEHKLEPDETIIAILKNCTMIVKLKEDRTLGVEFNGADPFVIDESLDMYSEE